MGDIAPDDSERQRHRAAPAAAAASSYRPAPVLASAFPAPAATAAGSSAHPVFSRGSLRSAPSPNHQAKGARAHQRSPSPPPLVEAEEAEEEDAFMMDDDDESDGKTAKVYEGPSAHTRAPSRGSTGYGLGLGLGSQRLQTVCRWSRSRFEVGPQKGLRGLLLHVLCWG